MRELAKYVMRGPKQAIVVAFCGVLIPMMYWVSAAVIALVTLRQGVQKGLSIIVWSLIPALGCWVGWQDPSALIVMLTAWIMAVVLRTTVSWQSTLASGAVVTLLVGMAVPHLLPELVDTLMKLAEPVFLEMARNAQMEYDANAKEGFRLIMIASFSATYYAFALVALILARSWQAQIFNPGGWKTEFHQIRMSPLLASISILMLMFAPNIGMSAMLVMMVVTIPALVCGLALVHGVIAKKNLGGQWLVGFYVSAIMLFPTLLVLLIIVAYIDSLVDFRRRVQVTGL